MKPETMDIFKFELESTLKKLQSRIRNAVNGVNDTELYAIVNQIDFFKELSKSGYLKSVDKVMDQYDKDIVSLITLARKRKILQFVNGSVLDDLDELANLDGKFLLRRGEHYADDLKRYLLRGIKLEGSTSQKFNSDLLDKINERVPYKDYWLDSVLHTSYAEFNAGATQKIFENDPDVKFKLVGPRDEETRSACSYVLENQPVEGVSLSKIKKGYFPYMTKKGKEGIYTFIHRGGFNCRHFWRVV